MKQELVRRFIVIDEDGKLHEVEELRNVGDGSRRDRADSLSGKTEMWRMIPPARVEPLEKGFYRINGVRGRCRFLRALAPPLPDARR